MSMETKNNVNPKYKHVSAREKYCFGIGAIGKDAIVNLVGAFLMLYFTDTLYLAPAFVGVLFFVARIWDAVNDPMMGMIVDNTRFPLRQIPYLADYRNPCKLCCICTSVPQFQLKRHRSLRLCIGYVHTLRHDLHHYGCALLVLAS